MLLFVSREVGALYVGQVTELSLYRHDLRTPGFNHLVIRGVKRGKRAAGIQHTGKLNINNKRNILRFAAQAIGVLGAESEPVYTIVLEVEGACPVLAERKGHP